MMRAIAALLLGLVATATFAQDQAVLRVAVATNFSVPLKALARAYTGETGVRISASSASTGVLYTQVIHGAPFDLVLAADSERPARLVAEGAADNRVTYAVGKLVLAYHESLGAQAQAGIETVIARPGISLAIANPELAPYGRAAQAVLGRFPTARPRILTGANVGQAMQMWVSGGADAAFVAASFAPDRFLPVPAQWHPPIEQQAVILAGSNQPAAARQFLDWLTGPTARDIILQHGYSVPETVDG